MRTHCSTFSTARAPMRRRRAETAGPQRAREVAPGPDVALSIDPIRLSHGWLESSPPSDLRILSLWARFRRSRRSCRISMTVAACSVVAAASAFSAGRTVPPIQRDRTPALIDRAGPVVSLAQLGHDHQCPQPAHHKAPVLLRPSQDGRRRGAGRVSKFTARYRRSQRYSLAPVPKR